MSIVNFNVKSFRIRSLSYGKVAKNPVTRFTFQIKVYLGQNANSLGFEPTEMRPMGS